MKKIYSKKQLAMLIINDNPDIFIPLDTLIDDLACIYKIRKIAKKILHNDLYNDALLKNLVTTSKNIFGDNSTKLYDIILTTEELEAVKDFI